MAIKLSEKQIAGGWKIVKFGEIAKEIRSTTKTPTDDGLEFYVGLEHLDPQSLRISRKGIIAEDNPSFTRRFSAGQILFGKRRCYQKKAAVADFGGICSGDIIVIEAVPKKILAGLLPFIIQSDAFFDWAEKTSSGSLSPRTKWKSLAEFEFPLPPLERQKEILEVLEKLEECYAITVETIKMSCLAMIVSTTRIINQHSDSKRKVKDIAEVIRGITYSGSDEDQNGCINVLRANNVSLGDGKLCLNDVRKIKNKALKNIQEIRSNDILMCMSSGSITHLGKATLINKDMPNYYAGGFMSIIRASDSETSKYLSVYFKLPQFKKYLQGITAGTNIQNLKNSDVSSFRLSFISGEKMNRFIEVVDSFQNQNDSLLRKREKLKLIRQKLWEHTRGGDIQ